MSETTEEQKWVIESTVELTLRTVMVNDERPSLEYARRVVDGGYYEQEVLGKRTIIENVEPLEN